MFEVITAGAIAGLISAPHCALMCGPLGVHAATCGSGSHGLLRYQVARAAAYVLLGIGAGLLGEPLLAVLWSSKASLVLSLALALVMLRTAISMWPSAKRASRFSIRKSSRNDLVSLKPRRSLFSRALAKLPRNPALLGACSTLLPCGALWSGVALAIASGSWTSGAVLMFCFAVVSGMGVSASSLLATRSSSPSPARSRFLSGLLALGAFVLLWRPIAMRESFRERTPGSESQASEIQSCPLHPAGPK